MTPDQEERLVQAFESIGDGINRLYDGMQARFLRDYPPPKERNDSTVTHLQTEEERLRQEQGESQESTEEWVGLREERFKRGETADTEDGEPEE